MTCNCDFCCSMCEGYIEDKTVRVSLPARIIDTSGVHQHGHLMSVNPVVIQWPAAASPSLNEVVADANELSGVGRGGDRYTSFAQLISALQKNSNARRVKLGVKVNDSGQKFLVDVQKLTEEQFEVRDPSDPTAMTMVEFETHPIFSNILTMTHKLMEQMSKRQRIDGEHVIQMQVVDIPDLSEESKDWSFAAPRDTWNTRAVSVAIMKAAPADVLPDLRIIASENDGGFWCIFTHPVTQQDVKLLMSIVPLAWWRPYARKVEEFLLRSSALDGVTAIMKSGRRAVVVNVPAEGSDGALEAERGDDAMEL